MVWFSFGFATCHAFFSSFELLLDVPTSSSCWIEVSNFCLKPILFFILIFMWQHFVIWFAGTLCGSLSSYQLSAASSFFLILNHPAGPSFNLLLHIYVISEFISTYPSVFGGQLTAWPPHSSFVFSVFFVTTKKQLTWTVKNIEPWTHVSVIILIYCQDYPAT